MMIRTIAITALLCSLPLVAIAQSEHDGHDEHNHDAARAPAAASGGGSIVIRAVQGTEGGPAVANDQVTVEILAGNGQRARQITTRLDEHGVAIIEGLDLSTPFRPRVTVKHAGGSYDAVGEVMSPSQPTQEITVKVFETTEKEPDWNITMSHIAFDITSDGIAASYMLVAHNPSDRAWFSAPDANGARYSIAIDLPQGARNIKMGEGPHSCCVEITDGRVLSTMPLMPGTSTFKIEYLLPITKSEVEVVLKTPAPVNQLVAFFPDDQNIKLRSESMERLGPGRYKLFGNRTANIFSATNLPAGKEIKLTISGLSRPLTTQEIAASSPYLARIIAALGTLILLVLAVTTLLRKPETSPAGK